MGASAAGDVVGGLPAERSSFVGRRRELAELRGLLSEGRLVTLVGPGGVGKTRLALRGAAELKRSFPDGTAMADLTAVHDPALVVQQVAASLDVRDVSGRWLIGGLRQVIGERHLLLVLDNCEHLRDSCAVVVDALLESCPELRVIATSRVPLDVDGEFLLVVPPLALPTSGEAREVFGCEAVQLLEQRARAAAPGLRLASGDAPALAELCRQLDGLPLAIELAAVRLRTLSAADVVARLGDRFRLLRRSGAAVPERHRTLRATMEWTLALLGEPEQLLWRRAAVFSGAFEMAAAESICADQALPAEAVLETLSQLVEVSVLTVVPGPGGSRFRMLETVRAFGRELLDASGESLTVRRRHRDWYAALSASASAEFIGSGQVRAFQSLDADRAELSAALEFCASTPGEEAAGLAVAADLWLYWEAAGHLGEGRRRVQALLTAPQPPGVRARGLAVAGYLALAATDSAAAVPLLTEALELAQDVDDAFVVAMATQYLGQAALFSADLPAAERLLREAAGRHEMLDGRYAAFCWADVGVVALLDGRCDTAKQAFRRSLALNEAGDPWTRSHALWGLGLVQLISGDAVEAILLERRALTLMREVDDRSGCALCIGALAWAAAAQHSWETAARLSGAAEATWRSIPAQLPPPIAAFGDPYVGSAVDAIGESGWRKLHGEGAALDRASAVALALNEQPAPSVVDVDHRRTATSALTKRQQEVAALVTLGLSDREIAARLVISPRTAESHVVQILTRLGVRNRAEIAAWMSRASAS